MIAPVVVASYDGVQRFRQSSREDGYQTVGVEDVCDRLPEVEHVVLLGLLLTAERP